MNLLIMLFQSPLYPEEHKEKPEYSRDYSYSYNIANSGFISI